MCIKFVSNCYKNVIKMLPLVARQALPLALGAKVQMVEALGPPSQRQGSFSRGCGSGA